MSRRYTKRRYRKSSRSKPRTKLRGGSKKPKAFIYTHLGLGDMCLMIGAVRYLATKYEKVTVVCKKMYKDTIQGVYADDPSIHFHMVSGDEDMSPWKEKAKKYESEGYDVYGCGMFSLKTDGKVYDFPNSFYDDLGIPRTARKDNFRVAETEAAKILYESFKGRPYIVVHQNASTTTLPIVEKLRAAGEKRLIIDVNKNQVDKNADPEGYAIAEKCINRPFTEYVKLFEGADELHMIDSAVFCFAMHLDLSKVKKRVYYIRPGGPEIDNFGKFEEGKISQAGGGAEDACKYISPIGLLKASDVHVKTYDNLSSCDFDRDYDMKNIRDGSVIYLRFDCFKQFVERLDTIPQRITIVLGNGDQTFPTDFFTDDEFTKFMEQDKIIRVFSMNINRDHPKLEGYPIGVDYHTLHKESMKWGPKMEATEQEAELESIRSAAGPFDKRELKCYSNFHFSMHEDRKYTQDRRDAHKQIPTECIHYEEKEIPRKQTWTNQAKYAFVACPHGNGLDCHRQWEALCLGCIPVVKRSSIDKIYEGLPVLIVGEWSDITPELLRSTVNDFKTRKFDYDRLLLKYWTDRMKSK